MTTTALNATGFSAGITASDLTKSIRFYTEGLGFTIETRHEEEGVLRYVSLKGGAANLGVGQDDFAKGKDRVKGVGMRLWIVTTQDLNAISTAVKAAGFAVESEPAALPWGPIAFTAKDPDGVSWTISNG